MATDVSKYQDLCGRLQGAKGFFMKDTAVFMVYDTDFEAEEIRHGLISQRQVTIINNSAGVMSVTTAPEGQVNLVMDAAASDASMALPSAIPGRRIVFNGVSGMNAAANLSILTTESMVGQLSTTNLSAIFLSAAGRVVLCCDTEGEWAIAEVNASVTEQNG